MPNLNDVDLLTKVFLPNFSDSKQQTGDAVLRYLVNNWDRLQGSNEVCETLSQTYFVQTGAYEKLVASP